MCACLSVENCKTHAGRLIIQINFRTRAQNFAPTPASYIAPFARAYGGCFFGHRSFGAPDRTVAEPADTAFLQSGTSLSCCRYRTIARAFYCAWAHLQLCGGPHSWAFGWPPRSMERESAGTQCTFGESWCGACGVIALGAGTGGQSRRYGWKLLWAGRWFLLWGKKAKKLLFERKQGEAKSENEE